MEAELPPRVLSFDEMSVQSPGQFSRFNAACSEQRLGSVEEIRRRVDRSKTPAGAARPLANRPWSTASSAGAPRA